MEVVGEQRAHKLQLQLLPLLLLLQSIQLQELVVPQQLEDATQHGLVIIIVMISITTWTAAMMAETVAMVVAVLLTRNTAQFADALIQMEAGVEQLAHKQQQALQIKIQQQLEDAPAPLHGLVIIYVMISITTWAAAMMAETVATVVAVL